MHPILALDMEEAKAYGTLIGFIVGGLGTLVGFTVNAIQNVQAKKERAQAMVVAKKTHANTNGKLHTLLKEVAGLKSDKASLKSRNKTLTNAAKARKKSSPSRTK